MIDEPGATETRKHTGNKRLIDEIISNLIMSGVP
jgi:hypothetical protein